MRIESSRATSNAARRRPQPAAGTGAARASADASVDAALPAVRSQDRPAPRQRGAYAPLLAQLIATRLDMPQTRARRRAEPAAAAEAYAAAGEASPVSPARLLRSA